MNDGELLRSYREAGDEKAFRELIERHADMIYSTAFRRMGDAHAAEDVAQAVFCLLLRYYRRLSLREVGAAFGVSEDAVRMRIGRALERLRRRLSGSLPAVAASAALEELMMAHAAEPAPASLVARIAAGARMPGVATSAGASVPVHWTGRIFTLKAGLGAVVLLCAVNLALWIYNDRNDPGSVPPGTAPATAIPGEDAVRMGAALGRGSSYRADMAARSREIKIQLELLRKIIESEVRDDSWPPNDLRQCVHNLAAEPQAALADFWEAIRDPSSRPATRERAVWGLWWLGEESPAMVPEFLPRLAGIIGSPDEPELWWHAADVIRHLSIPENSVSLVAEALSANPAAGYSTLRFWESATRRQPAEVSAAVRPWLQLEDPLRFCAAYALSLVEGERLEALLPVLADGLGDSLRQNHVLELLEQLGPAAADALPGLRSALAEPDNDHTGYIAAAIKAIDPSSPKPLFERDELLATLRGLSETVAELGPALAPSDHEAVTELIDDSRRFTPEQLADRARQLEAIHPRLRQVFVGELLKLYPALETVLDPGASPPAH